MFKIIILAFILSGVQSKCQQNLIYHKINDIFLNDVYHGEEFHDEVEFLNKYISESLLFNFKINPNTFGPKKLSVLNKTLNFSNDNNYNVEKLINSLRFSLKRKRENSDTKIKNIRDVILNYISKMVDIHEMYEDNEELFTIPFNSTFVLIDRDDFYVYFNSINKEQLLRQTESTNLKDEIDSNSNFILIEKSELEKLKYINFSI